MTLLEPVEPATIGHGDGHAILKADYDTRHPDAPLPVLTARDHTKIHRLLHLDADLDGLLPASDLTPGHIAHHNALHAAYKARTTQVGEPWSTA